MSFATRGMEGGAVYWREPYFPKGSVEQLWMHEVAYLQLFYAQE